MITHELILRSPDDFHLHLRRGEVLEKVISSNISSFGRALIMPNTLPKPIFTGKDAEEYQKEIFDVSKGWITKKVFTPLMTIKITNATTPEIILEAKKNYGVIAGKLYPEGVTTNSEDGVRDFKSLYPVLEAMQEVDMVLCVHGESPYEKIEGIEREEAFLPILQNFIRHFQKLRIVLEHVTTKAAASFILEQEDNIAGTITAHHLYLTLDDVIGYSQESRGKMQPHNFCKPIAKREKDRNFLVSLALKKNPKFFFGSDSAPHLKNTKECADVCAGVYTAPVALPLLVMLFDKYDALQNLEYFISRNGADFYKLPYNSDEIRLIKESWKVPEEYNGIVSFRAGKTLEWKCA